MCGICGGTLYIMPNGDIVCTSCGEVLTREEIEASDDLGVDLINVEMTVITVLIV